MLMRTPPTRSLPTLNSQPLIVAASAGIICLIVAQQSEHIPKIGDYLGSLKTRTGYWRAAVRIVALLEWLPRQTPKAR